MRFKKILLGLIGSLLLSQTVIADDVAHPYALFEVGRVYDHFSASNFGISGDNADQSWVFGGRVGLGYPIDPYIGIEAAFIGFQDRKINNLGGTDWDGLIKESAYDALTTVRFPITDNFGVIGKIGVAYVLATQDLLQDDSASSTPPGTTAAYALWRPEYALGFSYNSVDFSGAALSLTYNRIVGDGNKGLPDIELYMLGVRFTL